MKRRPQRVDPTSYLRGRVSELARPSTRAVSDPLADWASRTIRIDGRPLSFDGHEYLRAIFDDTSRHVVLSKAAQIGGTTWAILRSIHACVMGLNVMYFFPTRTDVLEFSKSRVRPLLDDNPFLAKQISDTDTAGLKRIGSAHLYLRGMKSAVGMKSVPADMIVFDELDEATPEAKTMARERLAHSDYKRIVELSNPSLPGYGIDEVYQDSDQRHWTIQCGACGDWIALDKAFPIKLGQDVPFIRPRQDGGYYRACVTCEAELDLAAGEWVADFPDREIHGYRISQLFSSKVDPGEILEEYRNTRFPDRFYNLKIGIPWADLERRLDANSVIELCTDEPMADSRGDNDGWYSMGVDTGKRLHVAIIQTYYDDTGTKERLVHLGVYHEFADLDGLMQRFRIDRCVIDGLPETHATREFASRHRPAVYMCFFAENQRGQPRWDSKAAQVAINRTEALDMSRSAIRDKQIRLPRRAPIVEEFAQHMTCDAKVLDEDPETGMQKYRYIRTGTNHYSLAFTYAWMASQANTGSRGLLAYMRTQARKLRSG